MCVTLLRQSRPLTRRQIAAIFRRHRGTQARVARKTRTTAPQVCKWLAGTMTSARIGKACVSQAKRLLRKESKH